MGTIATFTEATGFTLSDDSLTATKIISSWKQIVTNFPIKSDVYFEYTIIDANGGHVMVGVVDVSTTIGDYPGDNVGGYGYYANTGGLYVDGVSNSYGVTYTGGDIIGVAVSTSENTIEFFKNGVSQGVHSTTEGEEYTPSVGCYATGQQVKLISYEEDLTYPAPFGFTPGLVFPEVEGVTAKSIVLDIHDNWGDASYTQLRSIDFYLEGNKIELSNLDFTAYGQSYSSSNLGADNVFDTSTAKTGGASNNGWVGSGAGSIRLSCVFNEEIKFDKVVINNGHESSGYTARGPRNITISASMAAVDSTVYDDPIPEPTEIFKGEIEKHPALNAEDPQAIWILGSGVSYSVIPRSLGEVFEEAHYSYPGSAFNGVIDDPNAQGAWYAAGTGGIFKNTGYVGKAYSDPKNIGKVRICISGEQYDPKNLQIKVSNDGVNWEIAHVVTDLDNSSYGWREFTFNPVEGTHVVVDVTENHGDTTYLIIREVEFYEAHVIEEKVEREKTTSKSVILDFAEGYGYSKVGIRSVEFKLDGELIPVTEGFTAYATGRYNFNFDSAFAFDTSRSKTGTWTQNNWLASGSNLTNNRLIVVFDDPITYDEIVINNGHSEGTNVNMGMKNTVIQSTLEAVTDVTYGADVPSGVVLFDGVLLEHTLADEEDPQTVWLGEVMSGQAVPWTPAHADPDFWLDAADSSTIVLDGDGVSEWVDKSGNAKHALQPDASSRPTVLEGGVNGLNAIDFNGSQSIISTEIELNGASNMFMVLQADTLSGDRSPITCCDEDAVVPFQIYMTSGGQLRDWRTGCLSPVIAADETVLLHHYVDSAIDTWMSVNCIAGSEGGVASAFPGLRQMRLGASQVNGGMGGWDGLIAEIIIINGDIDDDEQYKYEGYLAHKWGLEANLPNDHPYKDAAPKAPLTEPWTPGHADTDLWLDASDSAAITLDGDGVSGWADKSGNGRTATQTIASVRPQISTWNGRNTVAFGPTQKYLNIDVPQGPTNNIFIVMRAGSAAVQTWRSILTGELGPPYSPFIYLSGSDANKTSIYWGSQDFSFSTVHRDDHLAHYAIKEASVEFRPNGGTLDTVPATASILSGWKYIGPGAIGSETTSYEIAEIIIISGDIENEERYKYEGYLAHKWGLEANLPDNHPYKTKSPQVEIAGAGEIWQPNEIDSAMWLAASAAYAVDIDGHASRLVDATGYKRTVESDNVSLYPTKHSSGSWLTFSGTERMNLWKGAPGRAINALAMFALVRSSSEAEQLVQAITTGFSSVMAGIALNPAGNEGKICSVGGRLNQLDPLLTAPLGDFTIGADTLIYAYWDFENGVYGGSINGETPTSIDLGFTGTTIDTVRGFCLGGDNPMTTPFVGDFSGAVVFDFMPTEEQRQLVEGHFAYAEDADISLPGGHPYSGSAPATTESEYIPAIQPIAPIYVDLTDGLIINFDGYNDSWASSKHKIGGVIKVDGIPARRRVVVSNRYSMERLAVTESDPETGEWSISHLPSMDDRMLLVTAFDDTGAYNAIPADYITAETTADAPAETPEV